VTSRLPDLSPPLADRFILGFPIGYGPVLLRMPFGSHLTVDTLPFGVSRAVLRPARLFPAAFGYSAPHSSARGTLTLLNSALLSAHFRFADRSTRSRFSRTPKIVFPVLLPGGKWEHAS
jgi:hypothetical protein